MNKVVLSIFIVLSSLFVSAQTGIKFQHKSFDEVCEMAVEQNKLVFIDFYTQWCGPCLNMVKTVFILPEVGEFYNKNFVCLKVDAETKEGRVLAQNYGVQSYPTYSFINPKNKKLVHHCGGRKSMEEFLAVGKSAIDPQKTSIYILSEYNNGNRSKDFLISYVRYMSSIFDRNAVSTGFGEIIKNGGKLTEPEIWNLYNDCISGYDNPYLKEVSDNYSKFVELFGKETVDTKLAKETGYCSEDFMDKLCDFEGKGFNLRFKKISDFIYKDNNYSEAIILIDSAISDKSLDKQKVIDRLKFMVRINERYGANYTDEWFFKSVEYLRYIAYNNADRDDARIHYEYALALEMLAERIAQKGNEIPEFLKNVPEYGKKEYSTRPDELKQKPKYRKK